MIQAPHQPVPRTAGTAQPSSWPPFVVGPRLSLRMQVACSEDAVRRRRQGSRARARGATSGSIGWPRVARTANEALGVGWPNPERGNVTDCVVDEVLRRDTLELLEKLAALVPRPFVNLIGYHGVLAPNAKWRREVVDFGRQRVDNASSASTPKKVAASHNRTWAELMRHPGNPPPSRSSLRPRRARTGPGTPRSSTTPGLVDRARL